MYICSMNKWKLLFVLMVFVLKGAASVIRCDELTVSIKTSGDSVYGRSFQLYRVSGDKSFEKINRNVVDYFRDKNIGYNDTTITDELILPLIYYKSLLFNSWENETERKNYCCSALLNLQVILFLAGKTNELHRIYLRLGPEIINYSFPDIVGEKKQRFRIYRYR